MLSELKKPEDIVRLERIRPNIKFRHCFLKALRDFFLNRNFLEVETPIMIHAPAPEDHINAPVAGDFFLRTSPELHMKRLIAAGYNKIFQIGPCFRDGEYGNLHNVEFSMLEWYEAGKDYIDLLAFTRELLVEVSKKALGTTLINFKGNNIDLEAEWKIYTVKDAFIKFAGIKPEDAIESNNFELILTEKVEPNLPKDKPVILKDYPASMAALSRLKKDDNSTAERWELYLGGIEIANAYSELIDPAEQQERFNTAHWKRKNSGLPQYPEDYDFLAALEHGMPPFAGIALGIDRLIMVMTDSNNIQETISFIR